MAPKKLNFDSIDTIVLDIEGTICPISFVKDELFPYFLREIPSVLSSIDFPLDAFSPNKIIEILNQFPQEYKTTQSDLLEHIQSLVRKDIKDSVLKSLQGFIWQKGYDKGEIVAPLFPDAIKYMKLWSQTKKLYIYSSGSIKAQKLLFEHVQTSETSQENINPLLNGYYDITTAGYKAEKSSYEAILSDINKKGETVLFLSDNPLEVKAAIEAGMSSLIIDRPGNHALSSQDRESYTVIETFDQI